MKTPSRHSGPTLVPSLDDVAERLDALLDDYTKEHRVWLTALADQRQAVRRADGPKVEAAAHAQQRVLERIAALEARRAALVNDAALALPAMKPDHARAISLRDLAGHLPAANAAALIARADTLRELIREAHRQTASLAGATRAMVGHMEGLMRHVARQLSHAGTYSRRGCVEVGGAVVSAVDLRS